MANKNLIKKSINNNRTIKHELPQTIDGYKVLKQLGGGDFANVYLVQGKQDKTQYFALKKILKPQWTAYIDEEIAALKIMSAYHYGPKLLNVKRNADEAYFLLDYIPGTNIRHYIKKNGVFSESKAFKFLIDILAELTYVHSHNTLHLDIKMTNIMRFNNKFCLIDWGVARSQTWVKTANILGGTRYLAPETYQGYRCQSSEIYSLGCVLYYCISGKFLFDLKKNDPLEKKIYATMYLPPTFDFPVTEKLKYIIQRMLEKDPLKRATITEIENIIAGHKEIERLEIKAIKINHNYSFPQTIYTVYKQMAEDDRNIVYAQYRLAFILEKGKFVQQNLKKALYWYKKAAIADYALAQHRLGYLLFSGKYGAKNFKIAFYWFSKAANQKYKHSQYFLGKMYELGKGVPQNKKKASSFYKAAMHNSDLKAEQRLIKLLKMNKI